MKSILITGADGHLGRAIARWLIANTDRQLLLWVHATDEQGRRSKSQILRELLVTGRCRLVAGDLTQAAPFADIDSTCVETIIHAAAVTHFGVALDVARAVNLEGTRRVLDFARTCPGLDRCQLLSTLYAAGLREGPIDEAPLSKAPAFANHYEWSKWAAERLVLDEFSDIPWQIVRVATVMAEDESGRVCVHNVVHNTLRLFYYGLLSVVPGQADTRIYMTTAAFAAAACAMLATHAEEGVFHVSDDGAHALTLDTMLDVVYETFQKDDQFRRQRMLRPLFCDWQSFTTLKDGARQFSAVISQSLESVSAFALQLYKDKDVGTSRMRAALPGLPVPNASNILPRACEHLIESRWGLADTAREFRLADTAREFRLREFRPKEREKSQ